MIEEVDVWSNSMINIYINSLFLLKLFELVRFWSKNGFDFTLCFSIRVMGNMTNNSLIRGEADKETQSAFWKFNFRVSDAEKLRDPKRELESQLAEVDIYGHDIRNVIDDTGFVQSIFLYIFTCYFAWIYRALTDCLPSWWPISQGWLWSRLCVARGGWRKSWRRSQHHPAPFEYGGLRNRENVQNIRNTKHCKIVLIFTAEWCIWFLLPLGMPEFLTNLRANAGVICSQNTVAKRNCFLIHKEAKEIRIYIYICTTRIRIKKQPNIKVFSGWPKYNQLLMMMWNVLTFILPVL